MSDIKIVSLNLKGINHVIKRQKIISHLKREQAQNAILQETHLTEQNTWSSDEDEWVKRES